ncbi:MAG TPA: hypothetical protein VL945_02375 [Candidatus Saccharimonadales bacterium]|nr:hypothetical protein [Candidatus Saccharimonadales bacterium]
MSGILIKDDKARDANETFEKGILRKVIRESWQGDVKRAAIDPKISQMLDEHATKMESLLGTFDYGALCMPNIISNTKKMSYKELVAYLSLLESIGVGYKHWFNSEFANIFLAGLTLKARDSQTITRHLDAFLASMEKRLTYYRTKSEKESLSIDALIMEYERKNSGFLKFFRKGEISLLRKMISMRNAKAKTLSRKRDRYSNIVVKVKGQKK